MNDIEILEKQLDNAKYLVKKYGKDIVTNMDYYNALEHAITALKERQADKDRIKELEEDKDTLRDLYWNECIPKSLVKEKIEELNKQEKAELKGMKGQDRYVVKQEYQHKRNILQELLGEKQDLQINKEE